jgi:hypothetical protein
VTTRSFGTIHDNCAGKLLLEFAACGYADTAVNNRHRNESPATAARALVVDLTDDVGTMRPLEERKTANEENSAAR